MEYRLKRTAAFVIDIILSLLVGAILIGACVFAYAILFDHQMNINLTQNAHIISSITFTLGFIVNNFYALRKHQASLGKNILGLKVRGTDNVAILLLRTLVPVLLSYNSVWLAIPITINYLLGYSPSKKCIHDYLLNTTVSDA